MVGEAAVYRRNLAGAVYNDLKKNRAQRDT
jgi:hypothetical protein